MGDYQTAFKAAQRIVKPKRDRFGIISAEAIIALPEDALLVAEMLLQNHAVSHGERSWRAWETQQKENR